MFEKPYNVLLIPVGLLVFGILPLPYGYYAVLRTVVMFVAGFAAFVEWDREKTMNGWAYVWVCTAVLFNPLLPVHLNRFLWFFLDLGTAWLFYYYWQQISAKDRSSKG